MLLAALLHYSEPHLSLTVSMSAAHTVAASSPQARTVYILQPSFFPLERALNDGPVALSQEPRVFYVASTRATHNLYLMADANGGEDDDLETILFEL